MSDMVNFKEETVDTILASGHTIDDIAWIGRNNSETFDIDSFFELCDFAYDAGYGSQKIVSDLIIAFKDGTWLEREEYDGSEWWSFMLYPDKPARANVNVERSDFVNVTYEDYRGRDQHDIIQF